MRLRLPALLLGALLLAGCFGGGEPVRQAPRPSAPARSDAAKVHIVQSGDTLYAIARRYGVDFRDLARWNRIGPPYTIYPKQRLQVSAAGGVAAAPAARPRPASPPPARPAARPTQPPARPPGKPASANPAPASQSATGSPAAPPPAPQPKPPAAAAAAGSWRWPTEGSVIRNYSANDPGRQGIKIAGEAGQPVRAARDGQVVYSGAGLVGYGELVIVKHAGGYLTAYGHNRRRLVSEGEQVKAGQPIAELGRTGTDREMLHFEIRVGGKPVDPLPLLQGR